MFGEWADLPSVFDADHRSIQLYRDPPLVLVDQRRLFGPDPRRHDRQHTPGGAPLGETTGVLLARVMTTDGFWIGLVLTNLGGDTTPFARVMLWVPEWCIRKWVSAYRDRR